jgi:hypothetical protein
MQTINVYTLSELPEEIKDYFMDNVAMFVTADQWDVQDYLRFDLNLDTSDMMVTEEEAYYEVRRFVLAELPKGMKRPEYVIISQWE